MVPGTTSRMTVTASGFDGMSFEAMADISVERSGSICKLITAERLWSFYVYNCSSRTGTGSGEIRVMERPGTGVVWKSSELKHHHRQ